MTISEKELSKLEEIDVYYGFDDFRKKKRIIQLDRVLINGVNKIIIDGLTLVLVGNKKEKARIVLHIGDYLKINREFGIYEIKSNKK